MWWLHNIVNVLTATELPIFNCLTTCYVNFISTRKMFFDSSQSNKAMYRLLNVDGKFKEWGLLHKMSSNTTLNILDHELSGVGNLFESRF